MAIRVLHFGLGPIGSAVVRQVAGRRGFQSVGAIDIDPSKVGRDVGLVAGLRRTLGVAVSADPSSSFRRSKPDVVVLCTSSSLRTVMPQIETVLRAGLPIVSTTEELACPIASNRALARTIDRLAKRAKVAVLGTGVNPGFAMDALPIALTGVCERVHRVEVDRIQDARIRRLPFQRKIGSGLTRAQFGKKVRDGSVRHVGLAESISMIAAALGWTLDRVTDRLRPKIATARVKSRLLTVAPGRVCGIVQDGVGYRHGKAVIRLHMEAYLGAPESYDAVRIAGSPSLSMKIAGGIHGDIATASMVVNSIPNVLTSAPGLQTMPDLPMPSCAPAR